MPDFVLETLICAMARPYSASNMPDSTLNSCERVDRRQQHIAVEVQVGVLDAVERVVVVMDALPGDVQRKTVALAAHALLTLGRRGAVGRGAGDQRCQLQVIAAVERQFDDTAVLDDSADRRVLRLYDRRIGHNRHDVCQLADGHRKGKTIRAAHLHVDVRLLGGREALELNFQRIGAGRHRRKDVDARVVRLCQANGVCIGVRQRHSHAWQHGAARIDHRSADLAGRSLRPHGGRQCQQHYGDSQDSPTHRTPPTVDTCYGSCDLTVRHGRVKTSLRGYDPKFQRSARRVNCPAPETR